MCLNPTSPLGESGLALSAQHIIQHLTSYIPNPSLIQYYISTYIKLGLPLLLQPPLAPNRWYQMATWAPIFDFFAILPVIFLIHFPTPFLIDFSSMLGPKIITKSV